MGLLGKFGCEGKSNELLVQVLVSLGIKFLVIHACFLLQGEIKRERWKNSPPLDFLFTFLSRSKNMSD